FRAFGLVRADGRDPLLDHQLRARARGSRDPQIEVITAKAFAGKHYAVYGLARSGLATVEALLASGAKVTAWDENPDARAKAELCSCEGRSPVLDPRLRGDTEWTTGEFDSLVVSP